MVRLLHSGVSHHQLAVIQHIMPHQRVDELLCLLAEFGWLFLQLFQALVQAVRNLHIPPPQLPHQLHIVIARHAQGVAGLHHVHYQPQYLRSLGTPDRPDHPGKIALRPGGG